MNWKRNESKKCSLEFGFSFQMIFIPEMGLFFNMCFKNKCIKRGLGNQLVSADFMHSGCPQHKWQGAFSQLV